MKIKAIDFLAPVALLSLLFGAGCSRTVYVPVQSERVRTDSVHIYSRGIDTVSRLDSVVVRVSGDTVTREVWRVRERVRLLSDGKTRVVHDTVRVDRAVPVSQSATAVTKPSVWSRLRSGMEALTVVLILAVGMVICVTVIKKVRP